MIQEMFAGTNQFRDEDGCNCRCWCETLYDNTFDTEMMYMEVVIIFP